MYRKVVIIFAFLLAAGSPASAKKEPAIPGGKPKQLSLVRVNVTGQPYDYFRPWQKKASFSKRGLGAVLPQGRVLVTADLVANQNYVEDVATKILTRYFLFSFTYNLSRFAGKSTPVMQGGNFKIIGDKTRM